MALTPKQKQQLKGLAHALKPIILLGNQGLTDAVKKEANRALADHELIKVRIPVQDRDERRQLFQELCEACEAELVQSIGSIGVLYRRRPAEEAVVAAPKKHGLKKDPRKKPRKNVRRNTR